MPPPISQKKTNMTHSFYCALATRTDQEGDCSARMRWAWIVALLLAWCVLGAPGRALAQNANDEFNPGANVDARSFAVQPDGKVLVGGGFITLGGQT
ncbi:hypothetical protein, partial [Paracidovorax cattleyae]